MRLTRENMNKIIRDTVSRRTRADRGLVAIYLHGSQLKDDFLLGGTTDIDLFIIHGDETPVDREIVSLSDEVHLDIAHHHQRNYRNTRELRLHPWQGPTIKDGKVLYDPYHFMDFTQASVRGQYERPEYAIERSRKQFDSARQIWQSLDNPSLSVGAKEVLLYLRALGNGVQSLIGLFGPPLTERRFLVNLPTRLAEAGRPGLYAGLLGLLGASKVDPEQLRKWVPLWQEAYLSLPADASPVRLHPARLCYYQNAFLALLASDQPQTAIWPLLSTWTLAIDQLGEGSSAWKEWYACLEQLQIIGEPFSARVDGLDAYLDMIEEAIENWANANGVSRY